MQNVEMFNARQKSDGWPARDRKINKEKEINL